MFEELTVASVEITAKKFSFISTIGPTFLSENALRSEIRNFYFKKTTSHPSIIRVKKKEKKRKKEERAPFSQSSALRVNNNFYRATDFAKKGGTASKNVWLTFLSRKNWDEQ